MKKPFLLIRSPCSGCLSVDLSTTTMFTPSANDIQPPSPDALQAKGNVVHEAVEKNPEFGHGMLKYWDFAPGYRNLNAGTPQPPIPTV